ncbi:hypothetical protein ABPG75_009165 [Micractinium tetrahymenae]
MTWVPAPQRRILLESAAFIYAFGNTKSRSLWTGTSGEDYRALLLGFGDVRNVLATAAACASTGFDLCDVSPLNIARGLLLLHLASTIDPGSPDDLEFFWGISYCLRLSPAHAAWLAAAVRALLAAPGGPAAQAGDAATARVLESVLRGWVEGGSARGVGEVEAERRRLLRARLSTRMGGQRVGSDEQMRQVYQQQAVAALHRLLPWPRPGASNVMPEVHPNAGIASAPASPCALTAACLAELAAMLRGWQACRATRSIAVRFWCCDALALCTRLAAPEGGGVAGAAAAAAAGGPLGASVESTAAGSKEVKAPTAFDAIDTSNLPDHLGLLNVLALAGPLLRRAAHARLWTTHMLWSSGGGGALHEYLKLALGADPCMLPSLLGLRLVSDPTFGLDLPSPIMTRYGLTDMQDVLEWAPSPLTPTAPLTLTEGDGIAAAL